MLLKKFFINIFIRITLIALSGVVFGIVLAHMDQGYYYTVIGIIFIIALQTWMLIEKVNKTNRDLEKFLSSILDHDSSTNFPLKSENESFRKLHKRMNSINTIIHNTRLENERTRQFLQSVVEHVDIGLLSYDPDGNIGIYNKSAKKLLNIQQPHQLNSLKEKNSEVFDIINTIRPNEERLHKMKSNILPQNILIKGAELNFEGTSTKIISFQDITNELDKKELDSWLRLIRVLTHEIMNSISPITSLASVISGYFKKKHDGSMVNLDQIDQQIVLKTLAGLDTIEETGKGLLEFVEKYRSLSALPKPRVSKFAVNKLFGNCKLLMESAIPYNITIISDVSPGDLVLSADYAQIEQTLINLIRNAIEALNEKENGKIRLKAFHDTDKIIVQVEDNGIGISADNIENIFVPFFTTSEEGSGIGLSLSRQIMQNHSGTISVSSSPGKGSKFTLKFQNALT